MKLVMKGTSKFSYFIHPEVKTMLDRAKKQVLKEDWDRVYLIDGTEGSGKSLLGLQLGYYLDPTLNLDRVTFTGDEFSKAIDNAEKGQCIIFDEAFNGLSSSAAMSKMNRFLVRKLMECRQKNLFIIIILPTIFLLQKYVGIFRSRALFHVYVTRKGVRGYYRVYNESNKKLLYLLGHKMYSYAKPYLKKSYVFRGKYPVDEESYREKKHTSLVEEDPQEKDDRLLIQRNFILNKWYNVKRTTYKQMEVEFLECKYPLGRESLSKICQKTPKIRGISNT